jgi:CBS domain containing-hemolysin-like protein
MEDVMEAILGTEIVDENDRIIDLRELAKSRRDKRIAQFQFTEPQNAEQETLIHNNL